MEYLAAPVSGNAKVIKAGKLTFVVSGPKSAYEKAKPYLDMMGVGSSYVGEGELARIAKICHNVMLGVVIQNLCEITVLAQKAGMPRPIICCSRSRVIEVSGMGTPKCRPASRPRSRSLRSSFGVKVTWKSRLTSAGVL